MTCLFTREEDYKLLSKRPFKSLENEIHPVSSADVSLSKVWKEIYFMVITLFLLEC